MYLVRVFCSRPGWDIPVWWYDFPLLEQTMDDAMATTYRNEATLLVRYWMNQHVRFPLSVVFDVGNEPSGIHTQAWFGHEMETLGGRWEATDTAPWTWHTRLRWRVGNTFVTKQFPTCNDKAFYQYNNGNLGCRRYGDWQNNHAQMKADCATLLANLGVLSGHWQPQGLPCLPVPLEDGPHFDHVYIARNQRWRLSRTKREPLTIALDTIQAVILANYEYNVCREISDLELGDFYPTSVVENMRAAGALASQCALKWKETLLKEPPEGQNTAYNFSERRGDILRFADQLVTSIRNEAERIEQQVVPALQAETSVGGDTYFSHAKAQTATDSAEPFRRMLAWMLLVDFNSEQYPANGATIAPLIPGLLDEDP